MSKQWPIWFFVILLIVIVLFAFNYQGERDISLSELFPEENLEGLPDIEYEFVDQAVETESIKVGEAGEEISEAAAIALADATDVTESQTTVPTALKLTAGYTIQVASFKDKARAEAALKKALGEGFAAYVTSKDLAAKGTWHRIYIGRYTNNTQANQSLQKVRQKYKDAFIIAPKKRP